MAVEEEDKVQMQDDIQVDSNVQLDIQNSNHYGPEYQNVIGLWRNITEDARNFWCKRSSADCQHFNNDFLASCRQYDDYKRKFTLSMFRKHLEYERHKAVLEQFRSLGFYNRVQLFLSRHTVGRLCCNMLRTAKTELVLRRVNDIRWCARADATTALSKGYSSFQKALRVIAQDMTQFYK
ncbi:hypothetical protein TNCT_298871 [Trichonephila clavata]|uniref:Uncharacterized protein n=1 Tax=Trichonephila clavata TaxID=2740835 RepID=A0A8X6G8P5_TRICU|nr:hypothetical protein TNCT_298871 [Trichonephila clavata]